MSPHCWKGWGNSMGWNIIFAPVLPAPYLVVLGLLAIAITLYGVYLGARGVWWRALALSLLMLMLLNPNAQTQDRELIPDVAVVIVDRSDSQSVENRRAQTDEALLGVEAALDEMQGLESRITEVSSNAASNDGTALFTGLQQVFADVPRERIAGAILITDGQVHDLPKDAKALGFNAPVHALITGRKGERDRRLSILEAPRFGIVGQSITLIFRVDEGAPAEKTASPPADIAISINGAPEASVTAEIGVPTSVTLPLKHAGQNAIELTASPGPDELTLVNNRAVVMANGIRDRLRVLLVSGEPHPGERTWRNLLKADPSVDLVHFTILRPPEKQDATPLSELSLIAFPTQELFVDKLDQFDLVIFDRYRRRDVLPFEYFSNIARYVEKGGAVLEASGPAFATPYSIYSTPLNSVLPAEPTGNITTGRFRPLVTEAGKRHPVTAELPGDETSPPQWSDWFRLIDTKVKSGDVVMEGTGGKPLVVLSRQGEGRVAMLLSDQVWLWSRGYEGGGPQAELLRRIAHWLMKEPDLEEENLSASVDNGALVVRRRSMAEETPPAQITNPDGKTSELALTQAAPGRFEARQPVTELGLHRVTQGDLSAVAVAGPVNPREWADLRSTSELLKPIVDATRGGLFQLNAAGSNVPSIRSVRPDRVAAGDGWLGLRRNEQYLVRAVHETPLFTGVPALLLIFGALAMAWRREGR